MATPEIAVKSLEELYKNSEINLLAVVTQPDRPKGRGNKVTPPPVKVFAMENNIPCYQTEKISKDIELIEILKNLKPDFFVTFAFGQILSQEVLDIPKYSTINLHSFSLFNFFIISFSNLIRFLYKDVYITGIKLQA